jgi:hypothetical protein
MIRPLNTPHLCCAKPRTGLQSLSDLLPRLIAQYELQAKAHDQTAIGGDERSARKTRQKKPHPPKQRTFAWYR